MNNLRELQNGGYYSANYYSKKSRYGTHKNFETKIEAKNWLLKQKERLGIAFEAGNILIHPIGEINFKEVFILT